MAGSAIAAVGAAASAASAAHSIASGSKSGSSQAAADQTTQEDLALRQQAASLYDNITPPALSHDSYQGYQWLQDYVPQTYDPWIGQAYNFSDDQQSLAAQKQALAQMQQWSQGGLTPTDLESLHQIENAQAGAASSAAATSADNLRQRGLGGAGAEYAAMLAANQGSANNAQQLYDSAFQTALQRQLTSTQNAASTAGSIRQQSDSVSQQMAAINNQFNTEVQNLRTNAAQNAASVQNAAQAANLAGRQGVANENIDMYNTNTDLTRQLQQQQFNDQMQWTSGKANALNNQANAYGALAAAQGMQAQGQNQSTMNGLNTLGNLANSQTVQKAANGIANWFGGPTPGTSGGFNNGADLIQPGSSEAVVPPIPPEGGYQIA